MRILLIYLESLDNEPLGLMYVGTVLEKAGHSVRLIGAEKADYLGRILKQIRSFSADVIGISVVTPLFEKAKAISRSIRSFLPGKVLIAGGPHASVFPEQALKEMGVDFCVIGEAEVTIVELLDKIGQGQFPDAVKGLAYLKGATPVVTGPREYIRDLDSLPFVNRRLVPKSVIYGRAGYPLKNPCMLLITGRGCPYRCSFCQPTPEQIFGKGVRKRSPENVVAEIAELKNAYGVNGLWINDDTFLTDIEWAGRFCDLIRQERLDISWYANGRLNNIDRQMLIRMRDAGCSCLVLTPETGCQRIRNGVLDKNVSDDQVMEAYRLCHQIGLPVQANIMVGSPTESEGDLKMSLALIRKIQPHFMNYSYTTLLPKTHLSNLYCREIEASGFYRCAEDYDYSRFKPVATDLSRSSARRAIDFFRNRYSHSSFTNRARHFWRYRYFRKILFARWASLILSPHPKFRHLLFDLTAVIVGSLSYWFCRRDYLEELN